ncbi:hypothetical protein [Nocardioides nitrophenolicus]|uniref:hypothetical protein n=1 Tax=Nocardioides nitrophenolicus TaxID=60489 RepID=UPI00195E6784|nr:hypothetical protein [Nocardioides nitrophenolicus]MBM7518035.1 hypothetical protein [Nocardioides nitrophenolicus]
MSESPTLGADVLADTVTQTHAVLHARMRSAEASRPTRERPRAALSAADPFLASTSRHVAAANAVLAPAARRRLDRGQHRARELALQSRRLEVALAQVKAKLYGSTFVVRRPWAGIWEEVERELAATRALELRLVDDLAAASSPEECGRLAERLYRTERRVPTRPHPYLPHHGLSGRLARRVALQVDRFWDTAEGRMVPEPVRPRRGRDGRIAQYLLADPHITG